MNLKKKNYEVILILFWVGLSIFVIVLSFNLGLGGFHNPGPGLMPFLLGSFLFIISIFLLISYLYQKVRLDHSLKEKQEPINYGRLGIVLASLFTYSFLFETFGFFITTLLILIILFRGTNNRWYMSIFASILTTLISYVLFTYLGIRFPKGILK